MSDTFPTIPANLKSLRQWACFKLENGTKVPYQPTGEYAKSNDRSTWSDFETCEAAVISEKFDGLNFALDAGSGIVVIDMDDVCDRDTRIIKPEAQDIIDLCESYTERSPSGTGIHIIMSNSGKPPTENGWRKNKTMIPGSAVELGDSLHFLTFCGDWVEGTPLTVEDQTYVISEIARQHFPPLPAPVPFEASATPSPLSDAEIIERASKSSETFKRLWQGDMSDYDYDQSSADLALCRHLAFWTGKDAGRIELLFNQSQLVRKKWSIRADYRRRTILKAIEQTNNVYERPAPKTPKPDDAQQLQDAQEAYKKVVKETEFDIDAPPEKSKLESDIDRTLEILNGSRLSTMTVPAVSYLYEPFIPMNSIVAFTGLPAHGKSTFVMWVAHQLANTDHNVMAIYCDADNPPAIAKERSERLRGPLEDRISYWAGFTTDKDGHNVPPWSINQTDEDKTAKPWERPKPNKLWIELIKKLVSQGKHPVIVFDTLNSFMRGADENSNAVVGDLMVHLREMTDAGGTVIIIHHTGKGVSSRNSRGASAFEGGVDVGWSVAATIEDCVIKKMYLTAWKSRLGKTPRLVYNMIDGRPIATTDTPKDRLFEILKQNGGLSKDKFEVMVMEKYSFSRQSIRRFLTDGLAVGIITYNKQKLFVKEKPAEEPPDFTVDEDGIVTDERAA